VRVVGSVHPAADVKLDGTRLTFTTSELTRELHASGGKLTGAKKQRGDVVGQVACEPAPALKRAVPAAWSRPEALFDGKDLNGWEPDDPPNNR
jgi:hypothetical protein